MFLLFSEKYQHLRIQQAESCKDILCGPTSHYCTVVVCPAMPANYVMLREKILTEKQMRKDVHVIQGHYHEVEKIACFRAL